MLRQENNKGVMLTDVDTLITRNKQNHDIRQTNYDNIMTYIKTFISELDVRERTKETYSHSLDVFMRYLSDQNITQVNVFTILRYKDYLRDNYAPNSANTHLSSVKSFFKWIESRGIGIDVTRTVKNVKTPKGFNKHALTVEQVIDLLDSIETDSVKGKRDFALINLMINTGLRVSEVSNADVADIDNMSGKAILYIQGKGRESKDNFVLLEYDVLKPIYDYLHARGNHEGALFKGLSNNNKNRLSSDSISRTVKASMRAIGLDSPRLTAHSLRHTAITLSILGGADIVQAQAMARHSDINTTMIYNHSLNRVLNGGETNTSDYIRSARHDRENS